MAGVVISVRFSQAEKETLKRLRVERGFANISAMLRSAVGFEPAAEAPQGDEIESFESLVKLGVTTIDRLDKLTMLITSMGRSLGLRKLATPGGVAEMMSRNVPLEEEPKPEGFRR